MAGFQGLELRRLAGHLFPGFLLYAVFLMVVDSIIGANVTSSIILNPLKNVDAIISLSVAGVFVGTIFGIIIDSIAHYLVEHGLLRMWNPARIKWERNAMNQLASQLGINLPSHLNPSASPKADADFLFGLADTDASNDRKVDAAANTRESLVKDYYSYFEFYINTFVALLILAPILPRYMMVVLAADKVQATLGAILAMAFASVLLICANHTYCDYIEARLSRLVARLTANKRIQNFSVPPRSNEIWLDKYRASVLLLSAIPLILIGGVTGSIYASGVWFPEQYVTFEITSVHLTLNKTNNWSAHQIIMIRDTNRVQTTLDPILAFDSNNFNDTWQLDNKKAVVAVPYYPSNHDNPRGITLSVFGDRVEATGNHTYFGTVSAKGVRNSVDLWIDVYKSAP